MAIGVNMMGYKKEDYLSTSEFAKVCGVTKHTLFHYDDVGVLKPAFRDDKGYRYYALKQLSTYDIIVVLKEMNTSLKDIKKYLDNQNTDSFIEILQERSMQLAIEKRKIERTDKMIRNTLRMTAQALTNSFKPRIQETDAYKSNAIFELDPNAWYIMPGGVTSSLQMIKDLNVVIESIQN